MRHYVSLFVNGNPYRIAGDQAWLTLSDFLRQELGLIGTKIVCSEGDCGACSALIGIPSEESGTFAYQTIDSCIVFMHQLDRTHIISVEGIGDTKDLSAVQKAMVDCHGSQCGFCTPGFVVALHGLIEETHSCSGRKPTNDSTECPNTAAPNPAGARITGGPDNNRLSDECLGVGLSGNLCRCTGYVQILEAGRSIDVSQVQPLNDRYPPEPMLSEFDALSDDPVMLATEEVSVYLPKTLQEAVHFKSENPEARIVSGATDVGVQHNHGKPPTAASIVLNGVAELRRIDVLEDRLVVGAGVSWTKLIEAFREPFPEMVDILLRFGSPQIRNIGSFGGNIANASPIADCLPFLFVIDAVVQLTSKRGRRMVPINEFYHGYKQTELRDDELIEAIHCPRLKANEHLKLYKISKRRDMDISTFAAGLLIELDEGVVTSARVAMGGVGPTVIRTHNAESEMIGQPFTLESMQSAGELARREISAISDVRSGVGYREQLSENIFLKFFHDVSKKQEGCFQ